MSNRALTLALTIVATVVAPGAAQAMTTTVERTGSGVRIRVTGEGGAIGSKNAIGVSEDASANLVVSDTSPDTSAVVPAGSCFQISAKTVGCPPDPSNTTPLEVTSGEGDDAVSINLPQRSASGINSVFVNGGNGADAIFGSDGPDTLEGDGLTGGG